MDKLNAIYKKIPKATCRRCAACCVDVGIYSVEYENISEFIKQNISAKDRAEIQARLALNMAARKKQAEYMQKKNIAEMKSWEVCAFLNQEENACLIYSHRPLACRVFGAEKESRCYTGGLKIRGRAASKFDLQIWQDKLQLLSAAYSLSGRREKIIVWPMSLWFYFRDKLVRQGKEAEADAKHVG